VSTNIRRRAGVSGLSVLPGTRTGRKPLGDGRSASGVDVDDASAPIGQPVGHRRHDRAGTGAERAVGIKEPVFDRPDTEEIVARLIAEVTDAVVAVFGERVRAGVTVDLVGTPAGRSGVGGVVVPA
jgi:hypothetical protein